MHRARPPAGGGIRIRASGSVDQRFLATRDPVSGTAYYAMLVLCAVIHLLSVRT